MDKLYEYMSKRKSNRKYNMTPLGAEQLDEIKIFADQLIPLDENIRVEYEITEDVKNILPVKAPHYFIVYSENKEGYLENVGFMFQQMDLFLSSKGLGSCWLGLARPIERKDKSLEFVIILAFGQTPGNPYRESSEFKRKPLSDISKCVDNRLEMVRLAPSATNSQNWFFICKNEKIHVYRKKLNYAQMIMYNKMNQVDMGIAICYLYITSLHQGKMFCYLQEKDIDELKGYVYVGSVK